MIGLPIVECEACGYLQVVNERGERSPCYTCDAESIRWRRAMDEHRPGIAQSVLDEINARLDEAQNAFNLSTALTLDDLARAIGAMPTDHDRIDRLRWYNNRSSRMILIGTPYRRRESDPFYIDQPLPATIEK